MNVGDHVILCNGAGKSGEYAIDQMEKGSIKCTLVAELPPNAPTCRVHMYLAILKKENFELAVQKSVECGVSEITPVITERTIKTKINTERLEKIILEATEQSGRTDIAILNPAQKLPDAIANDTNEQKIIFHTADAPELNTLGLSGNTSIYIGPEGGFTPGEVAMAAECSVQSASLGTFILRGETAAIVATYRAVHGI